MKPSMKQNIKYTAPEVQTINFLIPRALCVGVNTSDGSGSNRIVDQSEFDPDSD